VADAVIEAEIAILVQCLDRPRKHDAVACGALGERRRTYRTHHVHMQLRFGEACEKRRKVVCRRGLDLGGVDGHIHSS